MNIEKGSLKMATSTSQHTQTYLDMHIDIQTISLVKLNRNFVAVVFLYIFVNKVECKIQT